MWLGVRVRLDVGTQVALVGEGLLANAALEGLLAGVGADVALEEPRSREALAAGRALAALVVGPHMHRVRGHRNVHLLAIGTMTRLLVHDRPDGNRNLALTHFTIILN